MGFISQSKVEAARQYWRQNLQNPVRMGNDELITVTSVDFDHLIQDSRIRRKPFRIPLILENIYEIYAAKQERRMGMSLWQEGENQLQGYAILDHGGTLRAMHIVRAQEARRFKRQGELLWKRSE